MNFVETGETVDTTYKVLWQSFNEKQNYSQFKKKENNLGNKYRGYSFFLHH